MEHGARTTNKYTLQTPALSGWNAVGMAMVAVAWA